jgi:putative transposase
MDMTHTACGSDSWGHLVAVIDRADREIVGYEFALRGRAVEVARAIETACLARFGTVRPQGKPPTYRSDNGLVFQSRRFRKACRFDWIRQEDVGPAVVAIAWKAQRRLYDRISRLTIRRPRSVQSSP